MLVSEENVTRWLSLGEASALLGVHASTLRRWADSGRVPCQRTPGGHRRFSRQNLMPLLNGGSTTTEEAPTAPASEQPWYSGFAETDQVDALRALGQRLGGVALQYLLRDDSDSRLIEDAHELGLRYAETSRTAGAGLAEAVGAFSYFRAAHLQVSAVAPSSDTTNQMRQFGRYDSLMSHVLLGLVEGYESSR